MQKTTLPIDYIDLAHSLRAPLTVLKTQTALAKLSQPSINSWQELTAVTEEQVTLLAGIIDDLGLLIKFEEDQLEPGTAKIDLIKLAEKIIEQNRGVAADKDCSITTIFNKQKRIVTADRTHLSTILQRLFDNSLRDGATKIVLEITDSRIIISDNGLGSQSDQADFGSSTPKFSRRSSIGVKTLVVLCSIYGWEAEFVTGPSGSQIEIKYREES